MSARPRTQNAYEGSSIHPMNFELNVSYETRLNPKLHKRLLEAFDHLHLLESKSMPNDTRHVELMDKVYKTFTDHLSLKQARDFGAHVYESNALATKAGVMNFSSDRELVIWIGRVEALMLVKMKIRKPKSTPTDGPSDGPSDSDTYARSIRYDPHASVDRLIG